VTPATDPFSETRATGGQRATPPDNAPQTYTGRPVADAKIASLGQRMIELQIINESQWNEALARAGTISDMEAVLEVLRRMPSLRHHRLEPNLPALTAYQASVIRDGKIDSLRLGPYLFIDQVGKGGMGEVFKAWNLNLDRIEAIKLVTHEEVTGSSVGLARFEREARALAQLSHPCITTIYNTGREKDTAYIAMEFVKGRTLLDVVRESKKKGEKVPEAWALEVIREVASALDHAHSVGIIHRDIKPNNIMITNDGEVRVLDMGIARLLDPGSKQPAVNLTRQVAGLGTPEVMPPEQWADASSVSPASDIYSLGCTFYYLLAGRMPFSADSLHGLMSAHLTSIPESLRTIRPDFSPQIDLIVQKMLAKEPRDRFTNCKELQAAINGAAVAPTTVPTPKSNLSAPTPSSKGKVWFLLAGLVVVAGLSAAAAYYIAHWKDFAKLRDEWVAEFQAANTETWPALATLRAVIQKEDAPTVNSDQSFDDFKIWIQHRTESQSRYRQEIYNWASSLQERKSNVWKSPQQLLDFFKNQMETVSSKEDIDTVRRMIEDETARLEAIRAKARSVLTSLQKEHEKLFSNPRELEVIAGKAVNIDEMTDEKEIDKLTSAVDVAVQGKWKEKLDSELAILQTDSFDVWKNTDAIRNHLGKKVNGPMAGQKVEFDQIRQDVMHETWKRRAHYWLTDYQADRPGIWKSAADLIRFVSDAFPKNIEDEPTYHRMEELVRNETRRRMDKTLQSWNREFSKKYPSLGPEADLANLSFDAKSEDAFTKTDGQKAFEESMLARAREQIFELRIPTANNPQADFQHTHLIKLIIWLAGLSAPGGPSPSAANANMELNGQPTDIIPLETKGTLTLKSSVAGYVTVIVLESSGRVFAFQWDQPIPADQKINVVRFDSSSPGEDRIICFVTEKNPRSLLPAPPVELKIGPVGVPTGFLEKFVLPPILPAKEDMERMISALPTPAVWEEIIAGFMDGPPPSYLAPTTLLGNWAKTSIKVKWGSTK
jgi:serine/threonine protein kinase